MARQVAPLAFAIGFSFLGLNPQWGFAIGSLIGNAVDPQKIRAPGLKELPTTGVAEGNFRQVAYGTTVLRECQLIDWGDLDPVEVEERQGKGGPVVVSQRLYQTYAIGLGEPAEAVRYIKRNGVMVYDVRPGSTILDESAEFANRFRFYPGSEAQLPDPDLEALPRNGVGNTPTYRGTAYLVFPRDDLTDSRGQIPTYEVEVLRTLTGEDSPYPQLMTTGKTYGGPRSALEVSADVVGWPANFDKVKISPVGGYAVGCDRYALAGTFFQIRKYNLSTGEWDVLANPADMPPQGPADFAWSSDGVYLAMAVGDVFSPDNVMVYKRTGNTFTKLDAPAQMPSQSAINVVWDDSNSRLAFTNATTGDSIVIYDFVADRLVNRRYINTTTLGLSWNRLDFMPGSGSRYLAAGSVDSTLTYLAIMDLTDLSTVLYDFVEASEGLFWDSTGTYLFTVGADGPDYLQVWEFGGPIGAETLTLVSAFDYQPASYPVTSAMSVDRRYLAVGIDSDQVPIVFDCQGATPPAPAKLSDLDSSGKNVISVSWSAPSQTTLGANGVLLSAIVSDICDRCGIPAGKLDLSALTDEVRGVTLGGAYDGAGAITTLMPAFLFDLFEADRQLIAVKRGGAVKATITVDDLLEEPDESTLRGQGIEYPRALQLKYLNPGQDYAAPAATVTNKTVSPRVRGEVNIDLPIAFNETEALNVASRMLKIMWEDVNGEATLSVPSGPFAWLTPTDCLGLVLRGATYRIRTEKVEQTGGRLKLTVRRDRQSATTSNLTAIPLPTPNPPPPSLAGATTFVAMNVPGRVDADDRLGFVFAMTGLPGTAWQGANIGYRVSGGTDWTSLGNFTDRAVMGTLTSPVPAASEFYTDTTNEVRVTLIGDDQLETITETQFLSEGNPCALVYPDGTAEFLQFLDAADDGGRAWTLSTLQRGRLATVAGAHAAGARFVMLAGAQFAPLPSALIGQNLQFRVTSLGTSPETAPVYDFTWNPVHSQLEFPPANLTLSRSGDTVSALAVPRHRFGTEDAPVASVNWSGYRFTATDGVNTLTEETGVTTPRVTFDCTGWASPVTVTVAQLNRLTGPGPALSESIA